MQITIKTDFPDVQRKLEQLRQDVATNAMASALNNIVDLAKTAMSREIRAEFNLSSSRIKQSLHVNRARASGGQFRLEASLESRNKRGRSLNLINFLENKTTLAQARGRAKLGTLSQLHVQIKRRGGKKALGSAFIGNKGRTIFIRVGKERLPIKALQTIDVSQMFNTRRINSKVVDMINTRLPAIFDHEARYFTDRFNAAR